MFSARVAWPLGNPVWLGLELPRFVPKAKSAVFTFAGPAVWFDEAQRVARSCASRFD